MAQLCSLSCQFVAGNGGGDGPAQRLEVGRADFPRALGVVSGELEGRYLAARRNGMQQLAQRLSGFGIVLAEQPRVGGGQRRDHSATVGRDRSEEHTSELQSLMRIPYAVFRLKK